ncbi:MAG: hypothetical protein IPN86_23500 [Saprospiraceae bacterium]|nr:hypothetical protein [Saprospiraceae bacterium]
MTRLAIIIILLASIFACHTTKPKSSNNLSDNNLKAPNNYDLLTWGTLDTLSGDIPNDTLGPFLRKIIYRDLSAVKIPINFSGTVVFKVCVDRSGLVTYAEVLQDGSTIKDKNTLKTYLKAATGYKYTADPTAPKQQCGKLKFTIDNSVKRSR